MGRRRSRRVCTAMFTRRFISGGHISIFTGLGMGRDTGHLIFFLFFFCKNTHVCLQQKCIHYWEQAQRIVGLEGGVISSVL